MISNSLRPPAVDIVARVLLEGFAFGDEDVIDQICAPDLVEHQLGMQGSGRQAIDKIKRAIREVHGAMPDLHFDIADWSQNGDVVWVRAEGTGTNTGPFLGPPTGKPVRFTVIDVARVRDGRIVEHWGVPDRFAILLQMGRIAVPTA